MLRKIFSVAAVPALGFLMLTLQGCGHGGTDPALLSPLAARPDPSSRYDMAAVKAIMDHSYNRATSIDHLGPGDVLSWRSEDWLGKRIDGITVATGAKGPRGCPVFRVDEFNDKHRTGLGGSWRLELCP